ATPAASTPPQHPPPPQHDPFASLGTLTHTPSVAILPYPSRTVARIVSALPFVVMVVPFPDCSSPDLAISRPRSLPATAPQTLGSHHARAGSARAPPLRSSPPPPAAAGHQIPHA